MNPVCLRCRKIEALRLDASYADYGNHHLVLPAHMQAPCLFMGQEHGILIPEPVFPANSGKSREREHQVEGFDLRVLARVDGSRDDSRGRLSPLFWAPGSGREKESEDPGRMRNVSGTNLSPAAAMTSRCQR